MNAVPQGRKLRVDVGLWSRGRVYPSRLGASHFAVKDGSGKVLFDLLGFYLTSNGASVDAILDKVIISELPADILTQFPELWESGPAWLLEKRVEEGFANVMESEFSTSLMRLHDLSEGESSTLESLKRICDEAGVALEVVRTTYRKIFGGKKP